MGFWIFMLCMNLLIPLLMILFGFCFIRKAPKEINFVFGYRTEMSMKNKDTWEFAHRYCGKLWLITGAIMLFLSLVAMCFLIGKSEDVIGNAGLIISLAEIALLIIPIFPTERALKRTFDKNGNRKERES